jgi:hypothetical protein
MKKLPVALIEQFKELLVKSKIDQRYRNHYIKWLRYYLDFCHKYEFNRYTHESFPFFLAKLKEKKQTVAQQQQAHKAISIYYEFVRSKMNGVRNDKRPLSPMVVKESRNSY